MKVLSRLVPAIGVGMLAMTALAAPAFASTGASAGDSGNAGAVFVQTDNTAGNAVAAYHRAADGTLTLAGTYPTGGLGGILNGSVVDHTGVAGVARRMTTSQRLLFAVNAGSDTVSVFRVSGDRLELRQVIWSGGAFPVSVTVHGNHAYVLDALGGGSLYGYRIAGRSPDADPRLFAAARPRPRPRRRSSRTRPGRWRSRPDGSRLLVTTKANGNDVDVFAVRPDGRLSRSPVVNSEPGAVPFAIAFDRAGHVLIAEAGPNALATFALSRRRADAAGGRRHRADGDLLGRPRGPVLLRLQRGQRLGERLHGRWRPAQLTALGNTTTDAGTVDASAAGRPVPLRADRGGRDRRRVRRRRRRRADRRSARSPWPARPAARASRRL